jgi:hypothetical protein
MKYSINKPVLQPLLIIILVHLFSCTPGSCLEETESMVKATFYSKETLKPVIPDSVTLYGINMDTLLLYDKTEKLQGAEFPLYAAEDDCKFVIRINGINDTIEFRYDSSTHLLSKECGYTFFFDLDTAIHTINIIDSISIVKNQITTFNEENMRIYY